MPSSDGRVVPPANPARRSGSQANTSEDSFAVMPPRDPNEDDEDEEDDNDEEPPVVREPDEE